MDSYLGEIMFFAGNYAPVNYLPCDGRTLNVAEYNALYSVLGTTYGGDGHTTFALPDLRARLPVGYGHGAGSPNTYVMGQKFGVTAVTLSSANLPAHAHLMAADSSNQAGIADPTGAYLTAAVESGTGAASCYAGSVTTAATLAAQTLDAAAGVTVPVPLDNRMPTMALTPIMCVVGLYPPQPQ